jgi:signal transduction histidine kinase
MRIIKFLHSIDLQTILFVPLGAGRECLGNLVLTRTTAELEWTPQECAAALDIGHDLGRALLNARTFERERRLVHELRELDGYKSKLIETLSHELKNPLTSILGHVEMLESVPDLPGVVRGSIDSMERGALRMQRLIEDLLALARFGDPNQEFNPVAVDLRLVIAEVLDLLAVSIERGGVTVEVDAPDEPVLAYGEPDGLDRLVANLVSNAIKYTPEGGTVTLRLTPQRRRVELTVTDTGLGISERDQEQIFTEFFRSTNPEAVKLPGTGLGLSIVRNIVERHGGRVTFDSELGHGTTFTVNLMSAPEPLSTTAQDESVEASA